MYRRLRSRSTRVHDLFKCKTAAGPVTVDTVAPMIVRELSLPIQPLVLADNPAVLSLGKRCLEEGYSFHWPAGEQPTFVGPDGKHIPLIVLHSVPYVQTLVPAVAAPLRPPAVPMRCDPPPASARVVLPPSPDSAPVEPALSLPIGDPPPACVRVDEFDVPAPEPSNLPLPALLDDLCLVDNSELADSDPLSRHRLMTHLPKHPRRASCQIATMQQKHHRRQYGVRPASFGDQVTVDHIMAEAEKSRSSSGDRNALIIYDRATRFRACYPLPSKSAECAAQALRHFLHEVPCRLLHSDSSPELASAARSLGIPHSVFVLRQTVSLSDRLDTFVRAPVASSTMLACPTSCGTLRSSTLLIRAM